jgi:hypothetical protein
MRRIAALALAVLVAGTLTACSDSNTDTTGSASTKETTSSKAGDSQGKDNSQSKGSQGDGSPSNSGEDSTGSGSQAKVVPLEVSGGGAGQFRVKGGDNSIQDFGEESDELELEEAATSLHDFYVASARGEWQKACSKLSDGVVDQLRVLALRVKQSGQGCAATLAGITPSLPPKVQKELTAVDAGSLRTKGEQAFLIYRGLEGTTYTIPMAQEDGVWKVGALAATAIS